MKIPLLLLAMLLLAACSTEPKRVPCDRHLVPINPPTPAKAAPKELPQ